VAHVYLANFYSWDVDVTPDTAGGAPPDTGGGPAFGSGLLLPQTEVLSIFQRQRCKLLFWLQQKPRLADEAMEAVERVVSRTGHRRRGANDPTARGWAPVGINGRYVPLTELPAALEASAAIAVAAAWEGHQGHHR
jgi:hypothetical protein